MSHYSIPISTGLTEPRVGNQGNHTRNLVKDRYVLKKYDWGATNEDVFGDMEKVSPSLQTARQMLI